MPKSVKFDDIKQAKNVGLKKEFNDNVGLMNQRRSNPVGYRGSRHTLCGRNVDGLRKSGLSAITLKHKKKVKKEKQESIRRCKSEGFPEGFAQKRRRTVKEVVGRMSGRRSICVKRSSEEWRDLCEFPVKPYYNDYSDHSTVTIPKSLQVKESQWTLRFESITADRRDIFRASTESIISEKQKGPVELEHAFVELRFTKSRGIVRICVLGVILVAIISALTDNCEFGKQLGTSSTMSICIKSKEALIQRRTIFMGIYMPIGVLWLGSTFFKFYCNFLSWLPALFVMIIGACSIAATHIGGMPDSAVYMVYLFMVWLFIRIPFYSSFVISWIMVFSYSCVRAAQLATADTMDYIELKDIFYLIIMNFVLTYGGYFWERTDRIEFIDSKVAAHIRSNTQNLLNQLIPPAIQNRIQNQNRADALVSPGDNGLGRTVIADEESDVSVLFSDIKGFTKFCSGVRAVDVVRALNTLYNRFDRKLEKAGAYKVETIGDAYFVSANCPLEAKDHAKRLVWLGHEMIQTCNGFRPGGTGDKDYKFKMRIGVHSGKVCAGVVGYKMPRYHLFGQTVTIAECMESSGEPGKVQISEATKRYLEEWENETKEELGFTWTPRGRREVTPEVFLRTYFIKFNV